MILLVEEKTEAQGSCPKPVGLGLRPCPVVPELLLSATMFSSHCRSFRGRGPSLCPARVETALFPLTSFFPAVVPFPLRREPLF